MQESTWLISVAIAAQPQGVSKPQRPQPLKAMAPQQPMKPQPMSSRQIEAARVALNRYMNRQGQVWIRIFPDKPITRKPADVRTGL